MNKKNPAWAFFASVKLALFTLFVLAVTSIIGTVIPQKEPASVYAEKYGANMAQLIDVLDIADMYASWWFLALLGLLSANLIICSIDRFPGVWKQIKADNLSTPVDRIRKMGRRESWQVEGSINDTATRLAADLGSKGWNPEQLEKDGGILLFGQKGAWSRTGVYIVHLSILVIFVGAIFGSLLGFKGGAMIAETKQVDSIHTFDTQESIDLGFTVRCDSFGIEFYPNGMPKDYRSVLTVLENGKEIQTTPIEVNEPLTYKGITFYQSSYQGYSDFLVKLTSEKSGAEKTFIVPYQQKTLWAEENIKFAVAQARAAGQTVSAMKILFSVGDNEPTSFWLDAGGTATLEGEAGNYLLHGKQLYATGLQVAKDPGVWIVYFGCTMMLLGLCVAFFMSHRRIWLFIEDDNGASNILLAGSANKNRTGFEKSFEVLKQDLQQS
ncbi:MAG: cytochrome c biogenesis protein ResB [Thermodesulfobacteriota bacterium]